MKWGKKLGSPHCLVFLHFTPKKIYHIKLSLSPRVASSICLAIRVKDIGIFSRTASQKCPKTPRWCLRTLSCSPFPGHIWFHSFHIFSYINLLIVQKLFYNFFYLFLHLFLYLSHFYSGFSELRDQTCPWYLRCSSPWIQAIMKSGILCSAPLLTIPTTLFGVFLAADEHSADISQNKMHWYNLTSTDVCICIHNLFSQVSLVNIPVAMMDISLTTGFQTAGLFKYAMS